MHRSSGSAVVAVLFLTSACATLGIPSNPREPRGDRASVIARSRVWTPTDIRAIDFQRGPQGRGSFPFHATVHCDYVDKTLEGHSPKFTCRIGPDDEVKVKYGGRNGEVYGEVLATRLLWGLGFGADRM